MTDFFPAASHLRATGREQEALHERAFHVMKERFGSKVFVRGVVEVSNYCRENCHYCGMRRDNKALHRFRLKPQEVVHDLLENLPASVTDLNIQTGEDPVAVREVVIPILKALREQTKLGLSVCLGTLSPDLYAALSEAGATIYIMKFELADPALYRKFEAPGSLDERVRNIRHLAQQGWSVSSGFIAGLPETTEEQWLQNFKLAAELPLAGCSVSPFIKPKEAPLHHYPNASIDLTLNSMAALRLMRQDWVIPAVSALDLAGGACGYERGLRTGANLVTINLTPTEVRDDYLLYTRDRVIMTEEKILAAMEKAGLSASSTSLADHYSKTSSLATV